MKYHFPWMIQYVSQQNLKLSTFLKCYLKISYRIHISEMITLFPYRLITNYVSPEEDINNYMNPLNMSYIQKKSGVS